MHNNNEIFIICGNSRSGKTSFSNFIKKNNKNFINTGMESLLALNSSRFILNKEKINFEMINYFYSRRFEGKDRTVSKISFQVFSKS